jgi:hypothetical protein
MYGWRSASTKGFIEQKLILNSWGYNVVAHEEIYHNMLILTEV